MTTPSNSPLSRIRGPIPRQLSPQELEALYYVHDRCAQMLTETLSVDPVSAAQWQIIAVEEKMMGQILKQTPPDAVWAFSDFGESLVGGVAMIFRKEAVLSMVQSGTPGGEQPVNEDGDIGESELSMLETSINRFTDALGMAWADYYQLTPTAKAAIIPATPPIQQIRGLLPGLTDRTITAVMTFRVMMVAREPQEVQMLFPQPYLGPLGGALRAILEAVRVEADEETIQQRIGAVDAVTAPLVVELGTTSMTVSEIQSLEVNTFLRLDQAIEDPLVVRVGSYRKLRGRPGTTPDGQFLAVQIAKM